MNNEDIIFQAKHDMKVNLIAGLLIIAGIITTWGFIIFNDDIIWQTIGIFFFPALVFVIIISIVGGICTIISFADADQNYIDYKKAEINQQNQKEDSK